MRSRFLLAGVVLVAAVLVFPIASSSASAGSGGTSPTVRSGATGKRNATPAKYERLWDRVSTRNKRWARNTSECESGGDPNATALGGSYRGAFMFTRDAWKTSPKTPGGDPIDYSYRTQAVVAVALKHRDGTAPWPVCG